MAIDLSTFQYNNVHKGTIDLFASFGIKFNTPSDKPINLRNMISQPSKAVEDVLNKLSVTYFVGTIDDKALHGEDEVLSLDDERSRIDEHYKGMLVFAVEVEDNETLSRSDIASLTRSLNRLSKAAPVALVVRYDYNHNEYIAFSICERTPYQSSAYTGEKAGKVSLLRDININTTHRGHIDILNSMIIGGVTTFDALYEKWLEVFSCETLTKRFYNELSNWYALALNVVRFPNDLNSTDDDTKYNHEGAIRLITRLIFVWFLKQRGLIPGELFDPKFVGEKLLKEFFPQEPVGLFGESQRVSYYYRGILQNLFFATLNCPLTKEGKSELTERRFKDGRSGFDVNNLMRYRNLFKDPDLFIELCNKIPFLNGGLFDCLDKKGEGGIYYDGFSERTASIEQLCVPDFLFFSDNIEADLSSFYDDTRRRNENVTGIIKIFNRYQFTVEENTPLDQEVALDPELLGKVFENLLASYNPETKTSARKQTGSFYTPREIVQYMVDESLIAHLNKVVDPALENEYRKLLSYNDEPITLNASQRKAVMRGLYNCKIFDPACGSGAFPMGILQQMVHILKKIDTDNTEWKDMLLQIAIDETTDAYKNATDDERKEAVADIERSFDAAVNRPDYARKLYLIENCIYGSDIQPIAIQISKLRFFISLVIDQVTNDDPAQNYGIRPLPNLEAKFVAANSLLSINRISSLGDTESVLAIKDELKRINHRIFGVKSNSTKKRLKIKLAETRQALAEELNSLGMFSNAESDMLAGWDMFDQNHHADFFDLEWMFGMKDGFDIVIGNPPYIQLQNNGGVLAKLYENCHFHTFARTGDIYCLFYEIGWRLLKESGHLCFITSNKWMRAGYGERTRAFFAKHTNPKYLIDFAGVKIFENATVDTNILLFAKEENEYKTKCIVTDKLNKDSLKNLSDFVQQQHTICNFSNEESWVILSPIEQSIKRKIESVGTPLKDWDIKIYRGVLTGYNDAFIISTEKRDEILANCQTEDEKLRTAELIRPILRGRDIKRYGYNWADLWLIATFPSRHYDIEQYPAVKAHLLSYGKERLEQSGKTYTIKGEKVKARKKTNNKWFETQDSISYWDDFSKPKVMWKIIGCNINFSFDDGAMICNNAVNIMTGKRYELLQFLGLMNSKLFEWYLKLTTEAEVQGGGIQLYVTTLEKTLVKLDFPMGLSEIISQRVNGIATDTDVDKAIFEAYKLTQEETDYILTCKQVDR